MKLDKKGAGERIKEKYIIIIIIIIILAAACCRFCSGSWTGDLVGWLVVLARVEGHAVRGLRRVDGN